MMQIICFHL